MKSSEFKLMKLPYDLDALEPHISRETMEFHWGKHHQSYVTNLNALIRGTDLEGVKDLQKIILTTKQGPIFNNAAQVYNHNFFFFGLTPNGNGAPSGKLLDMIQEKWGSFKNFKDNFTKIAIATFGSGWCWLVLNRNKELEIVSTSNAINPLLAGDTPLLVVDLWEHAYYIDYRNARALFLEAWWNVVCWDFVEGNMETPSVWKHESERKS